MANEKISLLNAGVQLTAPAAADLFPVTDTSDTTEAPSGTTKPISWLTLVKELFASRFAADAGANDTYTATLSPVPAALVTGEHYRFKANTANTGACTINFNGLGAKTIKKATGGITTDLADNDIRAGQWIDVVYDGTNMQMQSLLGNATAGGVGGVGDVVGPASSIDNEIAIFDSTTGKLLKAPGTLRWDGTALYATSANRTLGSMASGAWQHVDVLGGTVSGAGVWFTSGGGTADSSKISSIANGILIVTTSAGVGGAISTPANTQAQFTANQDNLTPAGPSRMQRWSSDASRDVTGMLMPGGNNNGQDHIIINVGSNNIVLKHDVTSTASNRWLNSTGADITLGPNEMAYTICDSTTQRWRTNKI